MAQWSLSRARKSSVSLYKISLALSQKINFLQLSLSCVVYLCIGKVDEVPRVLWGEKKVGMRHAKEFL